MNNQITAWSVNIYIGTCMQEALHWKQNLATIFPN